LPLKNIRDFELSPHKIAVWSALIHNTPPKSALNQALDHSPIVAFRNIGLPLLRPIGNIIAFQVQIDVYIMAEHILPQELKVALDALIVYHILLLPKLSLCAFQPFIQILLSSFFESLSLFLPSLSDCLAEAFSAMLCCLKLLFLLDGVQLGHLN
jgi:hypothetical protein